MSWRRRGQGFGLWILAANATASALGCAGTRAGEGSAVERAERLMAEAPARTGDLVLRCQPEDAEVEVDGVPWGLCSDFDGSPRGLALGGGMHRVEVKKSGFWPYETYYQPSGARAVLDVRLRPQKAQGVEP